MTATTTFKERQMVAKAKGMVMVGPLKQVSAAYHEGKPYLRRPIAQILKDHAIDETNPVVKKIREAKMLIEVGPSYTTGRLMQMGTKIGASPQELVAMGLALFAFWNQGYWKSTSGIHRFHFVMDMVNNYVPNYGYKGTYPFNPTDLIPKKSNTGGYTPRGNVPHYYV